MASYQQIPTRFQEILDSGETTSVDFKRVLPQKFEQKAMEAANSVGLTPRLSPFRFFIGVDEQTRPNGTVFGVPTGLKEHDGFIRDIETEKQKAVNFIRQVTPVPKFEIIDCNTATPTPFFVVELRGDGGPFNVDGIFRKRHASHGGASLEQIDFKRFLIADTEEFLAQHEASSGTSELLLRLLYGIQVVQSTVDGALAETHSELNDIRQRLAQLDDVSRSQEDLQQDLQLSADQSNQSIEHLAEQIEEGFAHVEPPAYVLQKEVNHYRQSFNLHWDFVFANPSLPAEYQSAATELQRILLDNTTTNADSDALQGELTGWRSSGVYPANTPGSSCNKMSSLTRAVWAVLGMKSRMKASRPWVDFERNENILAANQAVNRGRTPVGIPEPALLIGTPDLLRSRLTNATNSFEIESDLVVFRFRFTVLTVAFFENSAAILCTHGAKAELPESDEVLRSTRKALKRKSSSVIRCIPTSGGRLAPLAGQRRTRDEGRSLFS